MTPEDELSARRATCKLLLNLMTKRLLIPFFGAGVNLTNRPPGAAFDPEGPYLPNAAELSDSIAKEFNYPWKDPSLLRVSWYASVMGGKDMLYQHLHNIFSREYRTTDVHQFFARLPKKLASKGYLNRYQLIVTTNYDELLERAFDAENEPYDLFSYVVSSRRGVGKFKYTPYQGEPEPILKPNEFVAPIDRTVILKIHGAVNRQYWEHSSFVITEDDYIDYLAELNPEEIPALIKERMLHRRFLFLGYSLSDWNLRVLLRTIRASSPFNDPQWAIVSDHELWDPLYWKQHNVRLIKRPLSDYVETLTEQLESLPENPSGA
jgi:hypothetical protein